MYECLSPRGSGSASKVGRGRTYWNWTISSLVSRKLQISKFGFSTMMEKSAHLNLILNVDHNCLPSMWRAFLSKYYISTRFASYSCTIYSDAAPVNISSKKKLKNWCSTPRKYVLQSCVWPLSLRRDLLVFRLVYSCSSWWLLEQLKWPLFIRWIYVLIQWCWVNHKCCKCMHVFI